MFAAGALSGVLLPPQPLAPKVITSTNARPIRILIAPIEPLGRSTPATELLFTDQTQRAGARWLGAHGSGPNRGGRASRMRLRCATPGKSVGTPTGAPGLRDPAPRGVPNELKQIGQREVAQPPSTPVGLGQVCDAIGFRPSRPQVYWCTQERSHGTHTAAARPADPTPPEALKPVRRMQADNHRRWLDERVAPGGPRRARRHG